MPGRSSPRDPDRGTVPSRQPETLYWQIPALRLICFFSFNSITARPVSSLIICSATITMFSFSVFHCHSFLYSTLPAVSFVYYLKPLFFPILHAIFQHQLNIIFVNQVYTQSVMRACVAGICVHVLPEKPTAKAKRDRRVTTRSVRFMPKRNHAFFDSRTIRPSLSLSVCMKL